MDVPQIFPASHVVINYPAVSKSDLIEDLARRLCGVVDIDAQECVKALLDREALGSTAMGGGTAIPHARLLRLREPMGFVVRLKKAIDFDAIDGAPVSLVSLLLLPASDSQANAVVLAGVARRFRNPACVKNLKNAVTNSAFHDAFVRAPVSEAAEDRPARGMTRRPSLQR